MHCGICAFTQLNMRFWQDIISEQQSGAQLFSSLVHNRLGAHSKLCVLMSSAQQSYIPYWCLNRRTMRGRSVKHDHPLLQKEKELHRIFVLASKMSRALMSPR